MSFNKPNKAAAIRKFMAENPGAKAKDIAVGAGCDITYVYLVQSADRRKKKKPNRGQEVVRQVLGEDSSKIDRLENDRVLLLNDIARLRTIIEYLEARIDGASI